MNNTIKLIIEIPKHLYDVIKNKECTSKNVITTAVENGTPLDDVKAEIEKLNPVDYGSMFSYESHNGAKDMQIDVLQILDNIGKAESEDKE